MIDNNKILEIAGSIAKNFSPQKIILIGSYATGNPNADSDLDLLIIKETDKPKQHRSFDIRKSLIGSMIPIDILVYTPKEYNEEKSKDISFISNALKTAKVLYENINSEVCNK
jgi:predicted nucleotidyltransferase